MLPLDDADLIEVEEAGALLFVDPVRLERWARQRRIPATRRGGRLLLARAWVEAEAGTNPADPDGLRRFWLARLAPAAPRAARALLDRARLPARALLEPDAAARALCVDPVRLERLDAEGSLPALRVDGETRYDADLVDLLAREDGGGAEAAARRERVRDWARHEYVSALEAGGEAPCASTAPAQARAVAVAPRAWRLPEDLASPVPSRLGGAAAPQPPPSEGGTAPPPRERGLSEAEGFETVDEA